ncbi:MAG: tetratricopeptide repeat protein [Flavobacteriaceae bacterium]|nr:tetratricopeptide repeat protein [Flavobacteriaceae bacterium]
MKIISLILFFTFFYGYSQNENIDYVQNIADDACDCIAQINTETNTKNKAIKNCIASSIVSNLKTDVNKTEKDISEIQLENKGYRKIEAYLVENCDALKQLSFTENKDFNHANSGNVLAQLAYDDGLEYLDENNYEMAITKFTKAIEIDPKFAFAWDNLGVSYRKTNQYQEAIKAYKKSLQINPNGRLPLMNIAVTYNLNKEFDAAILYYNKFINIYKDDPEGYYGLGLILYTNNQQEAGLDNLIHAYTIYAKQNSPYRADAAKKIGYMYNDLKNQNKMEVFNKVASKYNLQIQNN